MNLLSKQPFVFTRTWFLVVCVTIVVAIVGCSVSMYNPAGPIDANTKGRNGYVSMMMNNQLWFPDSVSTSNYHSIDPGDSVRRVHIQIFAWSDNYTVTLTFRLPDTLAYNTRQSFVLCRTASMDFTTPWPLRNEWSHRGDSSGVLTVTRVDDSTVTGKFNAILESPLATYWLTNGNFYVRLAER